MKDKSSIAILVINTLLCVFIGLSTLFLLDGWGTVVKIVCYGIAAVGLIFSFVTFFLEKQALFKSCFIIVVVAAVTVAAVCAVNELGRLDEYATDEEKINRFVEIIEGFGGWGMAIFFVLQILQVVILPLPALVCYLPGTVIWGPLKATLLASAGVLVGSVIAYAIGKFFGKRAVVWIAGKETTEKYSAYLSKRGKVLFVLMQILPFFPDDILCMVVGLTGMNFWFFLATMVLVRPAVVATYCYLGSGTLIPFSGWGIGVWAAIIVVCAVLAVLSFKYQDKLEAWLVSKFARGKKAAEKEGGSNKDISAEYLPAVEEREEEFSSEENLKAKEAEPSPEEGDSPESHKAADGDAQDI